MLFSAQETGTTAPHCFTCVIYCQRGGHEMRKKQQTKQNATQTCTTSSTPISLLGVSSSFCSFSGYSSSLRAFIYYIVDEVRAGWRENTLKRICFAQQQGFLAAPKLVCNTKKHTSRRKVFVFSACELAARVCCWLLIGSWLLELGVAACSKEERTLPLAAAAADTLKPLLEASAAPRLLPPQPCSNRPLKA